MHDWISENPNQTVVLCGAGASQPHVPLSKDLGELVLDFLDSEATTQSQYDRLWMQVSEELRKLEDSNVEYLFQTLETLTYQESDPTRHWITGFKKIGSWDDSAEGREEFQAMAKLLMHRFQMTAYSIIDRESKDANLAHYRPMLNAGLSGIVTLNYDTLIERASIKHGAAVSTGATSWDGGYRWDFPDDCLPLLKLHGSVNWRLSNAEYEHWGIPRVGLYEVKGAADPAPNKLIDASLIFGAGNKLRHTGPWPALYSRFESMLAAARTLVIVGYSFADPHVDSAITRWASASGQHRILVVDPFSAEAPPLRSSIGYLRYAMDPSYVDERGGESYAARHPELARLEIVRKEAVEALPELFAGSSSL